MRLSRLEAQYRNVFTDLEEVTIPNCPQTLPPLYHYTAVQHLVRHVFDSSPKGYDLAAKLESCHWDIPLGPTEQMVGMGIA